MRTIFALLLLTLGLAACQSYPADPYGQGSYDYPAPAPPPYLPGADAPIPYPPLPAPVADGHYRAVGTEPFWDLVVGRDLVFNDRGNGMSVAEPAPPVQRTASGEAYRARRIAINIVRARCSDGMSDRSYPDTVTLTVDGRAYRGCGASAAFFNAVDEDGEPRLGEHDLGNTNWRVASINGRPLPASGHYLNFAPDRVSGRLGCNTLGANYTVLGSELRAEAVVMTRMACPDMQAETQGARIMGQPMTISESGDRLTLSNRLGAIDLIRAR